MHMQMIFGVYAMNYTRLIYARMDCDKSRGRNLPVIAEYRPGGMEIRCTLWDRGISWSIRYIHARTELYVYSRATARVAGFTYMRYDHGFTSSADVSIYKRHAWGINYEHT